MTVLQNTNTPLDDAVLQDTSGDQQLDDSSDNALYHQGAGALFAAFGALAAEQRAEQGEGATIEIPSDEFPYSHSVDEMAGRSFEDGAPTFFSDPPFIGDFQGLTEPETPPPGTIGIESPPLEREPLSLTGIDILDEDEVSVVPDTDPISLSTLNQLVDEDDLVDGTDDIKESLVVSRTINVDFGASGAAVADALVFTTNTITELQSYALQSDGNDVYYALVDGTMILAWTGTAPTGFDPLNATTAEVIAFFGANTFTPVFAIGIEENSGVYSYTYQLYNEFDNDTGDINQVFDTHVELPFELQMTTADGRSATAVFHVDVVDDVPDIIDFFGTNSVDEDDLKVADGASFDGTDATPESTIVTGVLSTTVDYGADGAGSVSYGLDPSLDGTTASFTSNGEAVYYTLSGTTLTAATAGGRVVFTLDVQSDGSYTFDLEDMIDHAAGSGENSMDLDFTLYANATDGDGDSVSAVGNLRIEVVDDVPAVTSVDIGTWGDADDTQVDEDGLSWGTDGDGVDTSDTGDLNLDGVTLATITYDWGADGPAPGASDTVDLTWDDLTNIDIEAPTGLTSNGLTVEYDAVTTDASGNYVLVAYVVTDPTTGARENVFTVTIAADGSTYDFDLERNLDHSAGGGENSLNLDFKLTGDFDTSSLGDTDYDLDPATGGVTPTFPGQEFTVTVVDDVPVAGPATEYTLDAAETTTVDEDGLPDGSDGDGVDLTATGDLGLDSALASVTVDWGADKATDGTTESSAVDLYFTDLDPSTVTITGPTGLTSDGQTVQYDAVVYNATTGTYTLQAYIDSPVYDPVTGNPIVDPITGVQLTTRVEVFRWKSRPTVPTTPSPCRTNSTMMPCRARIWKT